MSTESRKSTSSRLIVTAIDIGTTHSGYAFSFRSDWTRVFTNEWKGQKIASYKVSTALLLNPDKSFNSFGYEAEETYADIALYGEDEGRSFKEYYFFHRFKKTLKTTFTKRVHRDTTCKDKNGGKANAMLIFTLSIRYLKDHLLEVIRRTVGDEINADDIDFVLIWSETTKMFMREAAIQAGIPDNQLEIVLEPEAASIYCHLMHLDHIQENDKTNRFTRNPGIKYMVLDLGGGTTDITVYKLQEDMALTKLVATSSEELGGTNVDEAYIQFLEEIYGTDVLETFNRDPEYFINSFEYWYYFESKFQI